MGKRGRIELKRRRRMMIMIVEREVIRTRRNFLFLYREH